MIGEWFTPRHRPVSMEFREGTNDWNTLASIFTSDEYGLADTYLSGVALDIGAYLGGVAIALVLDNPDLRVIAIEPVPDNARLTRANIERNGLGERIVLLEAGAAGPGQRTTSVAWDWHGAPTESEGIQAMLREHRFVGGSTLALDHPGATHTDIRVKAYSIAQLLRFAGVERFSYAKIDCEGCEVPFLTGDTDRIDVIVGEYHTPYITAAGIKALLPSHDVYAEEPGPAPFRAVLR